MPIPRGQLPIRQAIAPGFAESDREASSRLPRNEYVSLNRPAPAHFGKGWFFCNLFLVLKARFSLQK